MSRNCFTSKLTTDQKPNQSNGLDRCGGPHVSAWVSELGRAATAEPRVSHTARITRTARVTFKWFGGLKAETVWEPEAPPGLGPRAWLLFADARSEFLYRTAKCAGVPFDVIDDVISDLDDLDLAAMPARGRA